jgi:Rrf2 family protein
MKIAQREDFALILMGILAENYSSKFVSLSRVAEETQLSPLFLKHIVLLLKKGGLVASKEGIDGGYRLARDPEKIAVADIIRAISVKVITPSCSRSNCRVKKISCACSKLWDRVNNYLFAYLKKMSLSEFVKL